MSHLAYPNLAHVENFTERHLDYTGITLDGWSDGPNLWFHLAFLILTLAVGGLPRRGRRIEGLWCLLNIIIIHPMDYFVGALGVGPKYLVDEYAVLDTRYWVLKDPCIMWVSYSEMFIQLPLEFAWYVMLQRKHWSRHFWCTLAGTYQLMGTIMYLGPEWSENFIHIEADWPPTFNSYNKIKYFWFIFIFLNNIWIWVPIYFYYDVYRKLSKALSQSKYKLD